MQILQPIYQISSLPKSCAYHFTKYDKKDAKLIKWIISERTGFITGKIQIWGCSRGWLLGKLRGDSEN